MMLCKHFFHHALTSYKCVDHSGMECSYLFRFRQQILIFCSFLGIVDKIGAAYEEDLTATSFGLYFCLPLLRSLYHDNMTEEEARATLEECARVGYYRNCMASNRVCVVNETLT